MKETAGQPPRTVLIIDDDAAHRLMLREAVKDKGHRSVEAASGEEGLKALETGVIDLILLDIKMPGMGGMEALKHIKTFNPALPVIIMTAYATVQTAIEALKLGAEDYLLKPLNLDELEEAIQAVIQPSNGKNIELPCLGTRAGRNGSRGREFRHERPA